MFLRASTLRTRLSSSIYPRLATLGHLTRRRHGIPLCRPLMIKTSPSNGKCKSLDSAIAVTSLISLGFISLSSNQSNVTSCKSSSSNLMMADQNDEFEHEWDDFMMKSMNPSEDDDDDDDDDEEDEEEEEEDEDEDEDNEDDEDEDQNGGDAEDQSNNEESFGKEEIDSLESDPYDNLPEEDDPTTCTICLINRQGPCRPMWRKFEKCMKDNSSAGGEGEGNDGQNKNISSSLGEKCDVYMLPWITCVQKFRNRYTLISNTFFQNEMIAEIENGIDDNDKKLLENFDVASIVQIGNEWSRVDPFKEVSDDDDVDLVEGVVSINLWDANQSRPIEIAFVKDQDGNLLGFEQFFDFKKTLDGNITTDPHDDSTSITSSSAKVGGCTFHANPATTKSIQIFALYRDDDSKQPKGQDESPTKEIPAVNRKQTLFYSKLLGMEEIPIQGQHLTSNFTEEESHDNNKSDVNDIQEEKEA